MWGILASLLGRMHNGVDTSGITTPNITDQISEEQYNPQKKKSGVLGGLASQWLGNRGGQVGGSTLSNSSSGANDMSKWG
jgi:hypothetical protein